MQPTWIQGKLYHFYKYTMCELEEKLGEVIAEEIEQKLDAKDILVVPF